MVHEVIRQGIRHIVIVDNASTVTNKDGIQNLKNKFSDIIHIISLDYNGGPDNGFNQGISVVVKRGYSEFIWLLDDDVLPEKNALQILVKFWDSYKTQNKSEKLCLVSYRKGWKVFKNAILRNDPYLPFGPKNSFRSFSFL
ncbi:MAG: glycosyltransferase, partial [Fidelibacterota bacterium]